MAAVELSADVPMTPQDMWDHVSDLSDLGDWLVMHEGWRSELPDEIAEGTQIIGVARAKGMRNRVTWTVTTWDPPHEVAMSGSGKGGAKYGVTGRSALLFRLAAIVQGVYKRGLDGNASSETATKYGNRAKAMADLAWSIVEKRA